MFIILNIAINTKLIVIWLLLITGCLFLYYVCRFLSMSPPEVINCRSTSIQVVMETGIGGPGLFANVFCAIILMEVLGSWQCVKGCAAKQPDLCMVFFYNLPMGRLCSQLPPPVAAGSAGFRRMPSPCEPLALCWLFERQQGPLKRTKDGSLRLAHLNCLLCTTSISACSKPSRPPPQPSISFLLPLVHPPFVFLFHKQAKMNGSEHLRRLFKIDCWFCPKKLIKKRK